MQVLDHRLLQLLNLCRLQNTVGSSWNFYGSMRTDP